jgi:hypothetical protein
MLPMFKLFLKCSNGILFCLRFSFHSFRYALKFSAHRRVSGITFIRYGQNRKLDNLKFWEQ